jgi:hypothetical protein
MMQTLDIHRPGMPDLQFALLVTALCTSRLTALNIPDAVRVRVFDRCWVLIHETPPPGRPEERVLDLRPWTEVTLDAMVETIRSVLTDAGIQTLTWDHTPSDFAQLSTTEAQPLIDRLVQVNNQEPQTRSMTVCEISGGSDLRQLIGELRVLMSALPPALKRCAATLARDGHDDESVVKLVKGADVLKESGFVYLSWAAHYAALSEGLEEVDETDGAGSSQ